MTAPGPQQAPPVRQGFRRVLTSSLLRWTLTLGILGGVIWLVNIDALWARLSDLSPGWLGLALLISVPQIMLSAWRWRLTASHMGMSLSLPTAISEYYLSTFLNQILPGG
ncbi:hypothetical protein B9G99_12720 [Kushneria konosiri]|uniref:Uncharacterized protein n=1 Tax=Kushneria konosiri TaxID=698828 RepID=A0A2Z2H879_9GAMM|nr:hypothetical protein B9G99_12720 [Kushneria konosiri]